MSGPIGANLTWDELLKVARSTDITLQSQSPESAEPVLSSVAGNPEPSRGRESSAAANKPQSLAVVSGGGGKQADDAAYRVKRRSILIDNACVY